METRSKTQAGKSVEGGNQDESPVEEEGYEGTIQNQNHVD